MGKGAVVLELNSGNVTLLTDEGAFVRIPVRRLPKARYIGQHVDLAELKSPQYGRWISVAAACLIFLLVVPLFRPAPAQAWVTLDGSSSLEVLLDHRFRVLEVRPLNNGGQQFLNDYSKQDLNFSALVDSYLAWSSENGDGKVLITSTGSTGDVNKIVSQRNSDDVDVVVFGVDPKAREEAGKLGVSAGRALFLAGADDQGISISLEQIKESNPFTALTAAGANVEQVMSSTADPETQAEIIQKLPKPDSEQPGDTAGSEQPAPSSDLTDGQDSGQAEDSGQEDKDTPPGQQDTPPGQQGKETPPGQQKKDDPGDQEDTDIPAQDDADTSSDQGDIPSVPDDSDTSPDQDMPEEDQGDNFIPPGHRDKADRDADKPPYGLKEKFKPRPVETAETWKEERTGPPFKDKDSDNNNGKGKGNNKP